jgi:FkbM family methyltransferase
MLALQAKRLVANVGARLHLAPHGAILFFDIERSLPHETIATVFDVGANTGQSAHKFATNFPKARIWSFEPSPDTFKVLKASTAGLKNVTPVNVGFSSASGTMRFDTRNSASDMHQIAADQSDNALPSARFTKLDDFCAEQRIKDVSFLKIDTEGHDLEVLAGAELMLRASAIGIIIVECSMSRDNRRHVALCDMQGFLEDRGYRLFGFYEQTNELFTGKPNLRRANVAFVSPSVIARN